MEKSINPGAPTEFESVPTGRGVSRVLILAPQPFYQDRGTPIGLRKAILALTEIGYHCDIVTFPGGRDPELPHTTYTQVAHPFVTGQIPIGFSLRKVWLDIFMFLEVRRRLRQFRYHSIHAVEEAGFLAVAAARRFGVPVVFDMQSSMAEQMARRGVLKLFPFRQFFDKAERWLIRRASVTMHSVGLEARVRRAGPAVRSGRWLYPPDAEAATPDRNEIRARIGLDDDSVAVVYTGNFASYQGVDLLLRAFARVTQRHRKAVLVMVGADRSTLCTSDRKLAESIPSNAVRFVGRLPARDVPGFVKAADIVVSPRSFGQNLPLKLIQYMAAAKPIVATRLRAHTAVVDDASAEIVGCSAEGLEGGINRLIEDRARAAAIGRGARERVAGDFSQETFRKLLTSVFTGLRPVGSRVGDTVSVVIPARDCGSFIGRVVESINAQDVGERSIEIIVVDDGSTDDTAAIAATAGARVVPSGAGGNPALARNLGASKSSGDPIVFLDADCVASPGWLRRLIQAHEAGYVCAGGSLGLPGGLSMTARWDYYTGWYHVHPRRPPGIVPNHPPCNISVRRAVFEQTSRFDHEEAVAYSHEELRWQGELARSGHKILFDPAARVDHFNRPGLRNLLRRNYRWGYGSLESKSQSGAARFAWVYRFPRLLVAANIALAPLQAIYVAWCWLRAGRLEPLFAFPVVLAARLAHTVGAAVGGFKWLNRGETDHPSERPRWQ